LPTDDPMVTLKVRKSTKQVILKAQGEFLQNHGERITIDALVKQLIDNNVMLQELQNRKSSY